MFSFQSSSIASDFWRQGLDVGLGTMFASLLSCFPLDMRSFANFGQSLCKAGPESAERMLSCLEAMPVYTELIGEVDSTIVSKSTTSDGEERWHLRVARRFRQDSDVYAPAGTIGIVHGQFVRWHCRFSAFR